MIVAFGDTMKDNLFKEKVGVYSARDIGRTAKERKAGSQGYAEAMLIAYNKKMKMPLRWEKLYKTSHSLIDEEYSNFELEELGSETSSE